jgi:predicted nucleic acid-binding protein
MKSGETSLAETRHYFALLASLPIVTDLESHKSTSVSTFALSVQFRLSIYDASYLELALRLGSVLASNDSTLIKAADKAGVSVFPR